MMSPATIGRYTVIRELGRGAMGVVFEASDPNLGRNVALKTIHANAVGANPEEAAQRFKNEARAAGSLNHPNIVTVFDAGEQDALLYLAMELLAGETLEAHLAKQRTLPLENAIEITRQVCAALDYAHGKGIVHRDIKPANIILLPNGTVKITDFGLARTAEAITMTGHVMGTPHYMSPEQVRGRPVDGRSDLFSVGVMLYEMVTGERPFDGQSITTIMYKIVHENPTPPRALDSSIPPGLSAVIERSMAKSPEERFQTGAALVAALENYKNFQPSASTAAAVSSPLASGVVPVVTQKFPPVAQAKPAKNRRGRKVIIGAACVVLFGVALLALLHRRSNSQKSTEPPQQVQAPAAPPAPPTPSSPNDDTQPDSAKKPNTAQVVQTEPATPGKSTATISVSSNPPTAAIFLDNKPTALKTPTQLQLSRGVHTLSVRMEGFQPANANFRVQGGENLAFAPRLTVRLPNVPGVNIPQVNIPEADLKKLDALQHKQVRSSEFWQQWAKAIEQETQGTASASELSILVDTHPKGAHIWINGNDSGKDAPAIIPEQPGKYRVRAELEGYETAEREVQVGSGRPAVANIHLKPSHGR